MSYAQYFPVLWIRIRSDPKLFAGFGSGVGSEINHFGSESGKPLLGMNLKQNFSNKIHKFSTNRTIFFPKKISLKSLSYKNICIVTAHLSRGRDQRCRIRNRIRSGVGSGVGAETSLKIGSGSRVRSKTNHFGSTTLVLSAFPVILFHPNVINFRFVCYPKQKTQESWPACLVSPAPQQRVNRRLAASTWTGYLYSRGLTGS